MCAQIGHRPNVNDVTSKARVIQVVREFIVVVENEPRRPCRIAELPLLDDDRAYVVQCVPDRPQVFRRRNARAIMGPTVTFAEVSCAHLMNGLNV